jgi:hypothetical protein
MPILLIVPIIVPIIAPIIAPIIVPIKNIPEIKKNPLTLEWDQSALLQGAGYQ